MVTATNLSEAQAIEQAGIDLIVAQGVEAGGHRGIFNADNDAAMTTIHLVQLLHKYCSIPIVAAGGIMTGQQARYALDSGIGCAIRDSIYSMHQFKCQHHVPRSVI
jgi:nitronate monooxygenase